MEKMWAGRFEKALDKQADDFNSSIHFDCRMYKQDITGSMVHAMMLSRQGIISSDEYHEILNGLSSILTDIENGNLQIDMNAEDIHMFVEAELTKR
ncbi:MAG: argininosuccinate lyase, partial [Clostridia bacterium]|nr:argininosuccinate lyase [Clostridia bacterium]